MTNVQHTRGTPAIIKKQGNKTLLITWEDGHVSPYSFRYLRQNCPCAGCIDEWTSAKTLNPGSIPLDLEGLKVEPVGGYGLSFSFSDQHATGIYHFDYLREICPCELCRKR
ncbi:MAG: DUF971 domain-containing protein [Nitrospirae bacterium]|nr:DUF971 domain-containing protein [Nitrospirota bacterium]